MKILVDASFRPAVAIELRALGVKGAKHVSEVELAIASDEDVLMWARAEAHVVVTRHDLEMVLIRNHAKTPSILRILAPGQDDVAIAATIRQVAMVNDETLTSGAMITSRTLPTG